MIWRCAFIKRSTLASQLLFRYNNTPTTLTNQHSNDLIFKFKRKTEINHIFPISSNNNNKKMYFEK